VKTPGEIWRDVQSLTTIELDYLKGQIQSEIKRRYVCAGKGQHEIPSVNETLEARGVERKTEAVGDTEANWLAP